MRACVEGTGEGEIEREDRGIDIAFELRSFMLRGA